MADPKGKTAADYTKYVVPSASAPGVLGTIGITTRGLKDALTIALGVGILIVGVALLVAGSKTAKSVVDVAANVVPGGNTVKGAVQKVVKS